MSKKPLPIVTLRLDKIVGGGQALGTMTNSDDNGRKLFVWGGLPGELVKVQLTKKKSHLAEGVVTEVVEPSPERIAPRDPGSYLSTSPWQIMNFEAEGRYKAALIEEAFELHDIVLPEPITVWSNGRDYEYRNKVEFSFWWDKEKKTLDLAFYRRGTHGKIAVTGTSLATPAINDASAKVLAVLRARKANGFELKTLLIRASQSGDVIAQLYVKAKDFAKFTDAELAATSLTGFELIYSNPRSPASVVTERLQQWGSEALSDTVSSVPFTYATEGFFQINLPVYERALEDMRQWVEPTKPTVDLYSGVGSIGLTIGGEHVTLVELNDAAVREMTRNIAALGREGSATAVLAASEQALEYITDEATIIVDPPRAGLHADVIDRLLEVKPQRIIYLSCNPVTQARDVARLASEYGVAAHQGYNFFPRTPHIEHLVVLERIM